MKVDSSTLDLRENSQTLDTEDEKQEETLNHKRDKV